MLYGTRRRGGCCRSGAGAALAVRLGEGAFPANQGSLPSCWATAVQPVAAAPGPARRGEGKVSELVAGGCGGALGWPRPVARAGLIAGRTRCFSVVSNHQIWPDFQGASEERFPHPRRFVAKFQRLLQAAELYRRFRCMHKAK